MKLHAMTRLSCSMLFAALLTSPVAADSVTLVDEARSVHSFVYPSACGPAGDNKYSKGFDPFEDTAFSEVGCAELSATASGWQSSSLSPSAFIAAGTGTAEAIGHETGFVRAYGASLFEVTFEVTSSCRYSIGGIIGTSVNDVAVRSTATVALMLDGGFELYRETVEAGQNMFVQDEGVLEPGLYIFLVEAEVFIDEVVPPNMNGGTMFELGMFLGAATERVCPDEPDDFARTLGGPVSGDATDLCVADDVRLNVLQSARVSPLLPFIRLHYWGNARFAEAPVASLDYRVEAHVSALVPGGQNPDTLRTWIRNHTTATWLLIDTRATEPNTDATITHRQDTDAEDYVRAGDGQIRVRHDVFDPGDVFSPHWFLKVDLFEVVVSYQ